MFWLIRKAKSINGIYFNGDLYKSNKVDEP